MALPVLLFGKARFQRAPGRSLAARSVGLASLLLLPSCTPDSRGDGNAPPVVPLTRIVTGAELSVIEFRAGDVLALLGDSAVVVSDADAAQVVVHSLTGSPVRRVGQKGSGPGEFLVPVAALSNSAGELVVADATLLRLSRFDHRLQYVDSKPTPAMPLNLLGRNGDEVMGLWIPFGPEGPIVGWVNLVTGKATTSFRPLTAAPDLATNVASDVPSPFLASAMGPGGRIFLGGGSRYTIVAVDSAGKIETVFGRPELPEERRSRAEQDEMEKRIRQVFATAGAAVPKEAERVLEEFRRKPKPFFVARSFAADSTGRLWVVTERGSGDSTFIDLFDREGEFQGTVTVRDRVKLIALRLPLLAVLVERRSGEHEGAEGVDLYRIGS